MRHKSACDTESSDGAGGRLASRVARRSFWIAVALLPASAAGCQSTACFVWEAGGSCPSQAAAMSFFFAGGCSIDVKSVDGEGHLDGQLCCYSVTKRSADDELECFRG